jgi:hypothetical protein
VLGGLEKSDASDAATLGISLSSLQGTLAIFALALPSMFLAVVFAMAR